MYNQLKKIKNAGITHQDIRLEDGCEITNLLSTVAICLPRNLVKAIIKPVTKIRSWPSPWFIVE